MSNSYKTPVLFILLAISFTFTTAQEKLKGNKIVTTENRNISEYTKVEIIDDLNVFLVYNEKQSVEIETDSNLQNAIVTELNDGVLSIRTSEIIGRKKALKVHLKVNKDLTEINGYNKSNISSNNSLIIDSLTVHCYDNSKLSLKLNSKFIDIQGNNSCKLNFEFLCDETTIRLEESSQLTGTIDTKDITIVTIDKTALSLEGSTDFLKLNSFGNSSFKGEKFSSKNAIIKANNDAIIFAHVTEKLDIYSNNSSELNIYSNPEIIIHEFYDKALIQKRELD